MELVLEAGDADTNGAVAGALLGARVGYSKLPKDWLDGLVEKEWLETHINRLLCVLGLISEEEALQLYKKIFTEIQQKQEIKALEALSHELTKKGGSRSTNMLLLGGSLGLCIIGFIYFWRRWIKNK